MRASLMLSGGATPCPWGGRIPILAVRYVPRPSVTPISLPKVSLRPNDKGLVLLSHGALNNAPMLRPSTSAASAATSTVPAVAAAVGHLRVRRPALLNRARRWWRWRRRFNSYTWTAAATCAASRSRHSTLTSIFPTVPAGDAHALTAVRLVHGSGRHLRRAVAQHASVRHLVAHFAGLRCRWLLASLCTFEIVALLAASCNFLCRRAAFLLSVLSMFFADLVVLPLGGSVEPHLAIRAPNRPVFATGACAALAQASLVIAALAELRVDVREISGCVYSQELPIQIVRRVHDELVACFNFCAFCRSGVHH
mmetsp:Transcript_10425/g.36588  ORF Transcript_10425/g.36588 Transcript_10425/m.36588 type:complete len:310 (-) Transcript_10425:5538-6467(-)